MVKDAEAAGFNPLTALRNGGSAGFSITSQPVLAHPGLGQAIGDAGNAIGNFLENFDPMADDKREQEYQLVQAQIRNLNASTEAFRRPQSFNVPTYTAGKRERRPSGQAAQLSKQVPPTAGETTVTNPLPLPERFGLEVNPAFVDSEQWETRYGDIAQEVGGFVNVVADVYQNLPPLGGSLGRWWRGDDKRPRLRRAGH